MGLLVNLNLPMILWLFFGIHIFGLLVLSNFDIFLSMYILSNIGLDVVVICQVAHFESSSTAKRESLLIIASILKLTLN